MQAASIAAKQAESPPPAKRGRGRPPKLSAVAEKVCREATRRLRSRKAKEAVRRVFAEGLSGELVAGWIQLQMSRLEQDREDEKIEAPEYHHRFSGLIDQARKLVEAQSRESLYDTPPLVNINIAMPESGHGPTGMGDVLEVG